jgi:hypothetical protein
MPNITDLVENLLMIYLFQVEPTPDMPVPGGTSHNTPVPYNFPAEYFRR